MAAPTDRPLPAAEEAAGLGGAIFVQQGGNLTVDGRSQHVRKYRCRRCGRMDQTGGQSGQGIGSGIFLQGNGSFTVAPGAGQTQTISDVIADQTGAVARRQRRQLVFRQERCRHDHTHGRRTPTPAASTVNAGILQGNASGLQGNIARTTPPSSSTRRATAPMPATCPAPAASPRPAPAIVTLTGTNTYSGGTTVSGGTLLFTSDANLGAAGSGITLNNGIIGVVATAPSDAR